jgi:DNA-binding transcriptional regulator YiaG
MADQVTTNQEFKQLKEQHGLTVTQCALMLECTEEAIKGWLKSPTVSSHRKTPLMALKLFKLVLSSQTDEGHPSE